MHPLLIYVLHFSYVRSFELGRVQCQVTRGELLLRLHRHRPCLLNCVTHATILQRAFHIISQGSRIVVNDDL